MRPALLLLIVGVLLSAACDNSDSGAGAVSESGSATTGKTPTTSTASSEVLFDETRAAQEVLTEKAAFYDSLPGVQKRALNLLQLLLASESGITEHEVLTTEEALARLRGDPFEGQPFRTKYFSFVLPKRWEKTPASFEGSLGNEYLLSSASFSPQGTARDSLVTLAAYDPLPLGDRFPYDSQVFSRAYTKALGGTITDGPIGTRIDGRPADWYTLSYEVGATPVRASVLRVFSRSPRPMVLVIQCQGELADGDAIDAGCHAIIDSLRIRSASS